MGRMMAWTCEASGQDELMSPHDVNESNCTEEKVIEKEEDQTVHEPEGGTGPKPRKKKVNSIGNSSNRVCNRMTDVAYTQVEKTYNNVLRKYLYRINMYTVSYSEVRCLHLFSTNFRRITKHINDCRHFHRCMPLRIFEACPYDFSKHDPYGKACVVVLLRFVEFPP